MALAAEGRPSLGRRVWDFPITRILAFLLLLFALFALPALGLSATLRFFHAHLARGSDLTGMVGAGLSAAATLMAFVLMTRLADRRTLEDAGLPVRGLFSETGIGLLIGGGVFSASVGMLSAFRAYQGGGMNAHFLPLIPLVSFLFVAVFEEVVFRGYVFQTLERRWGSGVALAGSCVFFGLAHLGNPVGHVTVWQKLAGPVFIILEAGLPMTAAFLLTRRLWLPIGIHWGWNFFEASVYGVPDSGTRLAPAHVLFTGHLHGPFLLAGGPFGPEAGLACLLCGTYAGVLLLRLAIRRGQWRGLPDAERGAEAVRRG